MSGNPQLDAQIMQAVQPRYNPMQGIQQMQQMPMQNMQQMPVQNMPVQNPVFGGSIPMNFGLPQASQPPAGYVPKLASFQPSQAPIVPVAKPVNPLLAYALGPTGDFSNFSGIYTGGD